MAACGFASRQVTWQPYSSAGGESSKGSACRQPPWLGRSTSCKLGGEGGRTRLRERREQGWREQSRCLKSGKEKGPLKVCRALRVLRGLEGEAICISGVVEHQPAGPQVVQVGDMVSTHFRCKTESGEVLQSSEGKEPLTFEVGAGNVMGNPLFQGFDAAVRGLTIGETRVFQATAGERREDFVFDVPRNHEEIERLMREAEAQNESPLQPGSLVLLANGEPAVIVDMDETTVRIDANHPLAGTPLVFEVDVVAINGVQEVVLLDQS